jgi:DNA-binding MarR family transcriptional regulator
MIDRSSNATRLVEKLRQKDLVKRVICENNRRKVDISITTKGLNQLKKLDELGHWAEVMKVTKSEAQTLNQLLDKIRG